MIVLYIIGIIVVLGIVCKPNQTGIGKAQVKTSLALSVILTLMLPFVGIIPLYFSIKAWIKQRKDNPLWEKELKSAYKWTKTSAIIYVILMIAGFIFYILLMCCIYYWNVDLSWLFWFL